MEDFVIKAFIEDDSSKPLSCVIIASLKFYPCVDLVKSACLAYADFQLCKVIHAAVWSGDGRRYWYSIDI